MSRGWTAVACAFVLGAASGAAEARRGDSIDSPAWTTQYDAYFQKYSKHYFGPLFEWQWFKAQAIAESGLREAANSPTGARGLMQILPSTFREIRRSNPHFEDIRAPRWNIAAGIYYDRSLYDQWPGVADQQRLYFSFASYNAGLGGIRSACRRAGHRSLWERVEPFAPRETQNYVRRIRKLKQQETVLRASAERKGVGKYRTLSVAIKDELL
jgi:membrane-bound lytic murein transglycosylase F